MKNWFLVYIKMPGDSAWYLPMLRVCRFCTVLLVFVFYPSLVAQTPDTLRWSLGQCIDHALSYSITIRQADLNKSDAAITYDQSRFSRLPNLNVSASQSFTNGTSIDPVTNNFLSQQINATNMGLNSQVTLYGGGQINNQIKQNQLLLQQNNLYLEEAKNNIALSVTDVYLQALYNYEAIRISEQTLQSSRQELEMTKSKYDLRILSRKELSDVQSQVATNQYNLVRAKNTYALQLLTLKQLLEIDPEKIFDIEKTKISELVLVVPDRMEIFRTASANLPEMKASQLQLDIDRRSIRIASAAYRPTLSAGASLNSGYTSSRSLPFNDQLYANFNQRVSVSLNVPIFNRNLTRARVESSKLGFQRSTFNIQTVQKELYRKIETAYLNLEASKSEVEAADLALQAAKTSYQLSQQQFQLGLITTTELIISQNSLANAEQRNVQSRYMSMLYYQLLQFYQGKPIKF